MSGKPSTPISSPKIPKNVKLNPPSTPPSKSKLKRLSGSFLKTPDRHDDSLPFSPSLKRSNSGTIRSPDYKLSENPNIQSPYGSNLLKTPRHTDYDSDENTSSNRFKVQKTPQFFSPGKKLFDDNSSPSKENLSEISLQLKNKLSSALGKLQLQKQSHEDTNNKLNFTELSFTTINESPSKKLKSSLTDNKWSPSLSVQKANLNLQTLQQSPIPKNSPTFSQFTKFDTVDLKQSPIDDESRFVNIPSPDEESSAHNALLAALSRQRRKSRSYSNSSSPNRPKVINNEASIYSNVSPSIGANASSFNHHPVKLPSLNMALKARSELDESDSSPKNNNGNNEQDAVLSLMSLSSPQSVKFTHSRNQSLNNNSPPSYASSINQSPQNQHGQPLPVLPPISGLIHSVPTGLAIGTGDRVDDNDATDIEEEDTDDDISSDK